MYHVGLVSLEQLVLTKRRNAAYQRRKVKISDNLTDEADETINNYTKMSFSLLHVFQVCTRVVTMVDCQQETRPGFERVEKGL